MKRSIYSLVAIPLWLTCFVFLAGAEGTCFGPASTCTGLDEQACLANPDCNAIYTGSLDGGIYNDQGIRCGGTSGIRCGGPAFDHCEDKPDCTSFNEQQCLADSNCQAIYGYPEENEPFLTGKGGAVPRCGAGTRCVPTPIEVFIECLNGGVDPCQGLSEQECYRRPICQAEYGMTECPPNADTGTMCGDKVGDGYIGCHKIVDQCTSDADCNIVIMEKDGVPAPTDVCPNPHGACENGQCVIKCDSGCTSDADCPQGEQCVWMPCTAPGCSSGTCMPIQQGCQSDQDCPAGQRCEWPICNCPSNDTNCVCGDGSGTCVPDTQDCQTTGCPEGYQCQVECTGACPPGSKCLGGCFGICEPIQQPCNSDADCPSGFVCQFTDWCGGADPSWCGGGTCVPAPQDCQVTGCPEGYQCQVMCAKCDPNGTDCPGCVGTCVPVQVTCTSDADCPAGQVCYVCPTCDAAYGTCVATVWMAEQPVQCTQTPWEEEAAAFPENYAKCMVNCSPGTNCGGGWSELCVLRTFLEMRGIVVYDARNVQDQPDVCASCACPRGNTFYVLVAEPDTAFVSQFGFWIYGGIR